MSEPVLEVLNEFVTVLQSEESDDPLYLISTEAAGKLAAGGSAAAIRAIYDIVMYDGMFRSCFLTRADKEEIGAPVPTVAEPRFSDKKVIDLASRIARSPGDF